MFTVTEITALPVFQARCVPQSTGNQCIHESHQLFAEASVPPWRLLQGKRAHGQAKLKTFRSP